MRCASLLSEEGDGAGHPPEQFEGVLLAAAELVIVPNVK